MQNQWKVERGQKQLKAAQNDTAVWASLLRVFANANAMMLLSAKAKEGSPSNPEAASFYPDDARACDLREGGVA